MTTILVIEDEAPLRESILDLLEVEGYEAIGAENGQIGVEMAQTPGIDLILCDIAMPGLDGYGVLAQLRQNSATARIPLIFLTAKATKADFRLGMKLGADDYLTKPFSQAELLDAVASRLDKQAVITQSYTLAIQQAVAQLDDYLHYDRVTRLPTRLLLQEQFNQIQAADSLYISSITGNKPRIAIVSLKIDRFDRLEELLGELGQDALFIAIAQRLISCVALKDTVARLNDDQFAIILAITEHHRSAAQTCQKILDALTPAFLLDNQEVFLTASLGIAVYPNDGTDLSELMRKANAAMRGVQDQGGDRYQFYTASTQRRNPDQLILESNLRRALERNEFQVYYQPQVNLKTGKIEGAEALLRWQTPERGFISPLDFIPLAEETGLIHPIGEWVLQSACTQAQAWRTAGFTSLRVAVNLSVKQFNQTDLGEKITRILQSTQLEPSALELELTESALMRDASAAVDTLNKLKALGVQIAIDDFGTGYASLSYLKQFPFDALKIDRCFIRNVDSDRCNTAITTAVLQLVHELNLNVIAEGVETEAELKFLCEHRCNAIQGYLFSRPVPACEFETLLTIDKRLSLSAIAR